MSIITFWNENREQSGRTLSAVAVATQLSIERNNKVLLISTSFGDETLKNCFWGETYTKNTKLFGNLKGNNIAVETGIEGLLKLLTSKKLTSDIITDYTKVILKGRLEVLEGFSKESIKTIAGTEEQLRKIEEAYIDLIKIANQYYDMVIVDLDKNMGQKAQQEILELSNVNVYILSQKLESINRYLELKKMNEKLMKVKCIPAIGKYMSKYKYNTKNISKYMGEKKELNTIPFNLLYMGATEESMVVDLFLKLRTLKDKTDENYIFIQEILSLTNNIVKKVQELQMKMR